MKTNKEISEWFYNQAWYSNFVSNFNCPADDVKEKESLVMTYLSEAPYENTLIDAFVWADTPEGYSFWNDANNKFLDFYGV